MHQVAHAAPPVLLPAEAERHYAGGHVLAASGVTYRRTAQGAEQLAATERRGGLDDADADALQSLGIDLDQVVRQAERALGPGALAPKRGTPGGRQLLGMRVETEIAQRGLRTRLRGDPDLGSLALTALGDHTRAARLLTELGAQPDRVRRRLQALPPPPRRQVPTIGLGNRPIPAERLAHRPEVTERPRTNHGLPPRAPNAGEAGPSGQPAEHAHVVLGGEAGLELGEVWRSPMSRT